MSLSTALTTQRAAIRRHLLEQRPGLGHALLEGPSGSLLIALPGGTIEIGRLPRRGTTRWVAIVPAPHQGPGRVSILDAATPRQLAVTAIRAADRLASGISSAPGTRALA